MTSISNMLKKRRFFVYENVNKEILELKNIGQIVSSKLKSKIYKKWWKKAKQIFK